MASSARPIMALNESSRNGRSGGKDKSSSEIPKLQRSLSGGEGEQQQRWQPQSMGGSAVEREGDMGDPLEGPRGTKLERSLEEDEGPGQKKGATGGRGRGRRRSLELDDRRLGKVESGPAVEQGGRAKLERKLENDDAPRRPRGGMGAKGSAPPASPRLERNLEDDDIPKRGAPGKPSQAKAPGGPLDSPRRVGIAVLPAEPGPRSALGLVGTPSHPIRTGTASPVGAPAQPNPAKPRCALGKPSVPARDSPRLVEGSSRTPGHGSPRASGLAGTPAQGSPKPRGEGPLVVVAQGCARGGGSVGPPAVAKATSPKAVVAAGMPAQGSPRAVVSPAGTYRERNLHEHKTSSYNERPGRAPPLGPGPQGCAPAQGDNVARAAQRIVQEGRVPLNSSSDSRIADGPRQPVGMLPKGKGQLAELEVAWDGSLSSCDSPKGGLVSMGSDTSYVSSDSLDSPTPAYGQDAQQPPTSLPKSMLSRSLYEDGAEGVPGQTKHRLSRSLDEDEGDAPSALSKQHSPSGQPKHSPKGQPNSRPNCSLEEAKGGSVFALKTQFSPPGQAQPRLNRSLDKDEAEGVPGQAKPRLNRSLDEDEGAPTQAGSRGKLQRSLEEDEAAEVKRRQAKARAAGKAGPLEEGEKVRKPEKKLERRLSGDDIQGKATASGRGRKEGHERVCPRGGV